MTTSRKIAPWRILRSRATEISGELKHRYLENMLLRCSEGTVAGTLREQPEFIADLRALLAEMAQTFNDGYDPGIVIGALPSLGRQTASLRQRLLEVVQSEYVVRFQPEKRLAELQRMACAFLDALEAWSGQVSRCGLDAQSAVLWEALRLRTGELHSLLARRDLRTRWIP